MKIFSGMIIVFVLCCPWSKYISAQVGINSDGSQPVSSAMLNVKATNKGFLPPQISLISTTDVSTIASPTAGLMVYNTNASITNGDDAVYYYFNGTKWVNFIAGKHFIGETYGGGKIFWVDETGDHGLISSLSDQNTGYGIQWYNGTNVATGAAADGVYAGSMNTVKIIAVQGNGSYAAKSCDNFSVTSNNICFTGWYLPSKYELQLMWVQRTVIGNFNTSNGIYWSSTETTTSATTSAWEMEFKYGGQYEDVKYSPNPVRCIRKF
jgi:hypothetical protein